MMIRRTIGVAPAITAGVAVLSLVAASPASAVTAQECSAKYQAAKSAGTLNGKAWNDFRKDQCGADAAAAPADGKAAEAQNAPAKAATKSAAAPASAGPANFPTAIDAKFVKEPPAKGRLHTCAEQWKANKAANTTAGLRWIQKGGGYWSECNKRLKS
jgi:hypothetical protein